MATTLLGHAKTPSESVMTESCFLCQRRFETPVVRESPLWLTVINRNQDRLGKTFISLRRHEEDVAALTPAEWAELRDEIRWVTARVRQAFAPDHFNYSFLMNRDAHVHLHVIPRYVGRRELAGVVITDAAYPDSYRAPPAAAEAASRAVIAAVEAALRS
jgi:diadenosine tetraphosphate (Ap4A) HIT family hydrolase